MKDIVIASWRILQESLILFGCFLAAIVVNVYSHLSLQDRVERTAHNAAHYTCRGSSFLCSGCVASRDCLLWQAGPATESP